jgi:hypothetical protein
VGDRGRAAALLSPPLEQNRRVSVPHTAPASNRTQFVAPVPRSAADEEVTTAIARWTLAIHQMTIETMRCAICRQVCPCEAANAAANTLVDRGIPLARPTSVNTDRPGDLKPVWWRRIGDQVSRWWAGTDAVAC